jgi:protein pelota
MKIVSRHIERDGSGSVSLIPEEDEDMYHLYNLVEPHDRVRAPAVRRVQSESSTGSIESHRVRVTLTIEVSKTTFDATGSNAPLDPAQAMDGSSTPSVDPSAGALGGGGGGEGATLQVAGRVVSENKHVKMGAFHTLDLECNRQVTIIKDSWDSIHLERLSDSSDVGQRAEVGAVVLGEGEISSECR